MIQGNYVALQGNFSPQPDRQRGNGQGRRTGALRSGGQQVCRAKLHTKQKVNLHSCRQDRTRQANNRDKGQGGNGLGTAHKKSGGGDTMQKGIGSTFMVIENTCALEQQHSSIRLSMRTGGLALLSLPVALDYLPNHKAAGFLLKVEMTLLYIMSCRDNVI